MVWSKHLNRKLTLLIRVIYILVIFWILNFKFDLGDVLKLCKWLRTQKSYMWSNDKEQNTYFERERCFIFKNEIDHVSIRVYLCSNMPLGDTTNGAIAVSIEWGGMWTRETLWLFQLKMKASHVSWPFYLIWISLTFSYELFFCSI